MEISCFRTASVDIYRTIKQASIKSVLGFRTASVDIYQEKIKLLDSLNEGFRTASVDIYPRLKTTGTLKKQGFRTASVDIYPPTSFFFASLKKVFVQHLLIFIPLKIKVYEIYYI